MKEVLDNVKQLIKMDLVNATNEVEVVNIPPAVGGSLFVFSNNLSEDKLTDSKLVRQLLLEKYKHHHCSDNE